MNELTTLYNANYDPVAKPAHYANSKIEVYLKWAIKVLEGDEK